LDDWPSQLPVPDAQAEVVTVTVSVAVPPLPSSTVTVTSVELLDVLGLSTLTEAPLPVCDQLLLLTDQL
jgi:hypothetical protein